MSSTASKTAVATSARVAVGERRSCPASRCPPPADDDGDHITLQALHWLNLDWEACGFMEFVADIEPTGDGSLRLMYGIDGLTGKEGTFLICSFRLVSAFAIVGELQQARDLMDRLLRIASPLGLHAEEFDAGTARHLGNFPRAFSHLALLEAADEDRRPRGDGAVLRRRATRWGDRASPKEDRWTRTT